jgi:seryl-tRNA synthetase
VTDLATDPYAALRDELIDADVLAPLGAPGLYAKGRAFIEVFDGIERYLTEAGASGSPQRYRFPPLLPRPDLVQTDYLRSFPNLIGSIHSFRGDDRAHAELLRAVEQGGDWTATLEPSELMLLPAACYPVYPMMTGQLPAGGRLFDVLGTCFRHEPSPDPARMQIFHQHEFVHLGTAASAHAFRDAWLERGLTLLGDLGLEVRAEVATDAFFGRTGRLLASSQRETALKYEILAPIADRANPTAIASSNWHLDHLTTPFGITTATGGTAESACVGFGVERITLALFAAHGTGTAGWPEAVRTRLWP